MIFKCVGLVDDKTQTHLRVHVFMDSCSTVAVPYPLQIGAYATVIVHSVMAVELLLDLCFWGIITCFPVIIVGIRAVPPADAGVIIFLSLRLVLLPHVSGQFFS